MQWLDAFWQLSTERSFGFGDIGPIPNSKIMEYSSRYGDEAEDFHHCMRAMDRVFMRAVRPRKEGEHRIMNSPLRPGMLKDMID